MNNRDTLRQIFRSSASSSTSRPWLDKDNYKLSPLENHRATKQSQHEDFSRVVKCFGNSNHQVEIVIVDTPLRKRPGNINGHRQLGFLNKRRQNKCLSCGGR